MLLHSLLLASLLLTPGAQRIGKEIVPNAPEIKTLGVSPWARDSVLYLQSEKVRVVDLGMLHCLYGWDPSEWYGKRRLARYHLLILVHRLRAVHPFDTVYSGSANDALLALFSPENPHREPGAKPKDWQSPDWNTRFEEIEEMERVGLFAGYPNGKFRGNAQVKRSELATVVARLIQRLPNKPPLDLNKNVLKRQDGDEWWYGAALIAIGSGVMNGYPDGWFRPNRSVNCEEAAVVFARLLALANSDGKR